jgi:zinc protease
MLRKTFVRLCLIALVASANVAGFAQSNARSSPVAVKPLDFKTRTLANGLKVIALEDHTSPTVTVQVWYRVGGKDDPDGRSGFAHLFEHMMFKSTKNMRNEMLDRLTEDVGGYNNASTWYDYTNYYEVVPANYLETLLWAEADRMVNLNVDAANFNSERDVVKEEYNQGVLAPPYGRFFNAIEMRSFPADSVRRTVIGTKEDLSAATLEDAQKFYRAFYRPDNAVLIVVGDFDAAQLNFWVDKYFGKIERPAGAIPYLNNDETERTAEKRFEEFAPNVPLPAVAISYLTPNTKNPDSAALAIAEAVLSSGESSRLYQELIYKQQVASEASVYSVTSGKKTMFAVYAVAAGGKTVGQIETALAAEIKKLQTAPVSAKELEKAKNKLITEALAARETNDGKAVALGRAEMLLNDAAEANRQIEKLQAVSAADVQRVAQKYFNDANRVVIAYKNETEKGGQK